MKTSDFYYELPEELIAQDPLEDRSSSRLLCLNRETGDIRHGHFRDILQELLPGDCLVVNDTKVIPARLYGRKSGTDALDVYKRQGLWMAGYIKILLREHSTGNSSGIGEKRWSL